MARPPTGQVVERQGRTGTTYAIRFRAYGDRHYVTTDAPTRADAEQELADTLVLVKRGLWRPPVKIEPELPAEPRTFHEFSSEWYERRRFEVGERTSEHWLWALSNHLLAPLGTVDVGAIGVEEVDSFKTTKLRERERYEAASEKERDDLSRPLSNGSINKCLKVLAMVLDDAISYGLHPGPNPVRGRLLKGNQPRRTWLEADEAAALIEGAGSTHRALIATLVLAGPRIGEATALRWRAVDLARGKLTIEKSKTDAGERVIDVSPMLLEQLKLHRAEATFSGPDDFVFATKNGTARERSNVTRQILRPAIKAANAKRVKAGLPPIGETTNHTLRRTFASLLYEAGASPAYVMSQMGHTSAALALEVYARKMERQRDTGERMDALVRGADWAQTGTSAIESPESVAA